jgi:hypothetical protein
MVALVLGSGFAVLGLLGFLLNPIATIAVNPVQNLLHLAIGAALLVCAFVGGAARCNAIVGTALLGVGIAGLFLISTPHNVLGVNGAANLLHFASAAVLLAVGLGARR